MSKKQAKIERAKELLQIARDAGCELRLEGHWVSCKPPMPVHLMLDYSDHSNEIAELLRNEK